MTKSIIILIALLGFFSTTKTNAQQLTYPGLVLEHIQPGIPCSQVTFRFSAKQYSMEVYAFNPQTGQIVSITTTVRGMDRATLCIPNNPGECMTLQLRGVPQVESLDYIESNILSFCAPTEPTLPKIGVDTMTVAKKPVLSFPGQVRRILRP